MRTVQRRRWRPGDNIQTMRRMKSVIVLLAALCAAAAEPPLPGLRIEPAGEGSIMYVRNLYSQPLTAFLIELVDYPGSSYSFWQDDLAQAIPAGAEKGFPVRNMLVGAAPDYVKVRAALYADGGSSGIPEKVAQFVVRRSVTLETTRELIRRITKAQSSGTSKDALSADLKQWAANLQPAGADRNSQTAMNQDAARTVVADAISRLDELSVEAVLTRLRNTERALTTIFSGRPRPHP